MRATESQATRVQFRHVITILCAIPIILWSVVLAGCTSSSGLQDVTLFALSYKADAADLTHIQPDPLLINSNFSQVVRSQVTVAQGATVIREVRVGYFSLCVASSAGTWSCSPHAEHLVASVVSSGDGDPLNLVRLAERIRTGTFFYGLIIISQVFLFVNIVILVFLPSVGKRSFEDYIYKSIPRPVPYSLLLIASIAAWLFGSLSAFWQHVGGAGAATLTRLLTYDAVTAQVGTTSVVLAWVATGITGVATLAAGSIIVSRAVLARLNRASERGSEGSQIGS